MMNSLQLSQDVMESPEGRRSREEAAWRRDGEGWLKVGANIARELRRAEGEVECSMWCAGDWLLEGCEKFGAHYKLGLQIFKYSMDTLYTAASVARRIDEGRRLKGLSFWHHREAARLEDVCEQDRVLALALKHDWSVRELRDAIYERRADQGTIAPAECGAVFVPQRWALEGLRWLQAQDLSALSAARKRALRRQLEPIIAIYTLLADDEDANSQERRKTLHSTPHKESIRRPAQSR